MKRNSVEPVKVWTNIAWNSGETKWWIFLPEVYVYCQHGKMTAIAPVETWREDSAMDKEKWERLL